MTTTIATTSNFIPSAFIVDSFICHLCGAIDNYVEDSIRGELVCTSCGAVNSEHMPIDHVVFNNRDVVYKTYKRIHHFAERMSQLCCREPKIPEEHMELIFEAHLGLLLSDEDYASRFEANPFNQHLIRKVLRSVIITKELEEKYRSRKFKRRLFTKKRFFEKYVSTIRWFSLFRRSCYPGREGT